MNEILTNIIAAAMILLINPLGITTSKTLSNVSYSLSNRYSNTFVNDVFSDNILLTIAYLGGKVKKGDTISWEAVEADWEVKFALKPGETFAFHDAVLEKYKGKVVLTTNAHFNSYEGFKSDGWLIGDGVCHLASFMYVAAKEAGLDVEAPTSHDFAVIPNIEKKDGVSIYSENTLQNLYITNNKSEKISFSFIHKEKTLTIQVATDNIDK
ncbi:MAG: VanW family protein [Patescibacteria group bacterium]